MKKCAWKTLLIFILLVSQQLALCNDEDAPLKKIYIVKGDRYYPPFEFINEKGEADGFNIELFKKIADNYKLKYVLQLDQWSEVVNQLETGQIDVVTGMMISEKRAQKFVFGIPHSMMTNGLFVQKNSNIRSLSDLKLKTIAVQKSDLMHHYIEEQNITPFLRITNSLLEALQLLNDGKCDAAIVGSFQGSGIIRQHKLKNVVQIGSELPSQPYAMAVSKGNEELLMILDKGLLNLKESGEYEALYQKWFGIYERESFMQKNKILMTLLLAIMLSLISIVVLARISLIKIKKKYNDQEIKYKKLINNLNDLIVTIDPEGRFTYVSPSYCELFGQTEESLLGNNFMPLVHDDDQEATKAAMEQLYQPPYHVSLEQRAFTKNGWRWIQWSDTAVRNEQNEVVEIIGVGQDITEKKKAELAKINSDQRFKSLLDTVYYIAVQGLRIDGTIAYWNKASELFYGYTEAEAVGKKIYDLIIPAELKEYVKESIRTMIETGEAIKAEELELLHKNGKTVNVYCNHVVVKNMDGEAELFSLDINLEELKKAEAIQNVLFNITNALSVQNTLEDMVDFIRTELNHLMDCSSLFIAFYDEETDMLITLNEKDEHENIPKWPAKGSLTGLIIQEKKSLLINKATFEKWVQTGKVQLVGKPAEIWMGVPLFEQETVIGAIVVQSFDNPLAYDESSIAILEFVSQHISQVLQKQRTLDNLMLAKQKAEESDQLKTSFLNNLSHEIRTPLNIIQGFAQLLESDDLQQTEKEKAAHSIRKSGKELTRIIDNIIVASTIETGQERMYPETNQPEILIEDWAKDYATDLAGTDIQFSYTINVNRRDTHITTDFYKLKKIVEHLMDNAIKFTGKGTVQLLFNLNETEMSICIRDSGPGIDTEQQQVIFERFFKLENHANKLYRGNGLGLGIVKAYADLLRGSLQLESSPGKGSSFHFVLPLEPSATRSFATKHALNKELDTTIPILVVEDDESNQFFIQSVLKSSKFEIISVKDGAESLKAIQEHPEINIVLMDLKLPVMDGFEASIQIRKLRPKIKIIAVTAYALHGDKQKAMDVGIDIYLTKPFKREELLDILDQIITHPDIMASANQTGAKKSNNTD